MRTLDRTLMIVLSALAAASLAAGCGDDEDGGGDVTTGIAPSTQLADVTTEQLASACPRLKAGFDRVFQADKLIRALCTMGGAAAADTSADCVTFRDQCIDQANMPGSDTMESLDGIDEFTCEGSDDGELAECTGTVGQLETCFNDMLDTFEAALNQFTCDDAASVTEEDFDGFGDMLGASPASCEAVGCPGGSPFAGEDDAESEP
jgi:hypothetical protein